MHRVIDTFTFFNELPMLLLRLTELDHVVDTFVLVEATITHSGLPKSLFFQENKAMFEKFST
jgi:beta-1,4-mannosyl-glycoprotein beta-1,4-N-acetylglucosaminyltransferase